jgi:hypothetical protein
MNKLEKWILRRIFRKALKQGHAHNANLKEIQSILFGVMAKEFREDSTFAISEVIRGAAREAYVDFHKTKVIS